MKSTITAVFIVFFLLSIFPVTAVVLYFNLNNLILAGYMNGSMFLVLGMMEDMEEKEA